MLVARVLGWLLPTGRLARSAYTHTDRALPGYRYLQFPISYRDLERMLADRGVEVDHITLSR